MGGLVTVGARGYLIFLVMVSMLMWMFVCLCEWVWVCISMYKWMYACEYVYMYGNVRMCICMGVCKYGWVHMCMCVCVYVCLHVCGVVVGLFFYIFSISNVISGWVTTCESAHSWRFYSASPLGDQVTSTMTWYPTQSHYPDTDPIRPGPILIMPNAWLRSNMDQY